MASREQSYQRQASKHVRRKGINTGIPKAGRATQGGNGKTDCTTGPWSSLSTCYFPSCGHDWARFQICMEANSIPTERQPKVFLTNQSKATFKLISTLAAQMATPKEIENLTMEEIVAFMDEQYDSRKFIVQERFRFWSQMQRKPGETVPELAARIRQDAAKCDFDAIKDPQDEAMRTRFICSIGNEAVLKAIFKVSDEELTFSKAVKIAQDTEDAAKAAKGAMLRIWAGTGIEGKGSKNYKKSNEPKKHNTAENVSKGKSCYRCNRDNHQADECRYKDATCNFCKKKGHIETACLLKKRKQKIGSITAKKTRVVKCLHTSDRQPIYKSVYMNGRDYKFQVDTGSQDNFCDQTIWKELGRPKLHEPDFEYTGAGDEQMKVLGKFKHPVKTDAAGKSKTVEFVVTKHPLNLLGITALRQLQVNVDP